jgi:cyclase
MAGIFVAALVSSLVSIAHAQNQPAPLPLKIEKLKDDLYVITGDAGNTTIYVTDEGVVMVDDKFERNYDDLMSKVRSITDKPIKYVINTHAHGDHTGSNAKVPSTAVIIGHENARAAMVKGKQAGPPSLTYTDRIAIRIGGKEVIAFHPGRCHTDGDTFVYFSAVKVMSTGDCYNTANGQGVNLTNSPTFSLYTDYNTGGSFAAWDKTADEVLKWDFDTVVPGHGPVANRALMLKWREDMGAIQKRIRSMVREGKTKEDVQKMLVSGFGWDPKGRATVSSIDGMMRELKD